jgi:hypothetical protein
MSPEITPLMLLLPELLEIKVRLLGLEIAPEVKVPVPLLMVTLALYWGATAIKPADPLPPVATALPEPDEPPPPPAP